MSIILFFYFGLLTEAFGQSNKPLSFKKQRTKLLREARTSVYLGDKNHQVVILESNFPKVARKFADKFPASTKPLWIKEGATLFAYFLNSGKRAAAAFSSGGYMNYSITNLDISSVPENLKEKIKAEYKAYSIFCAKEIINGEDKLYEMVLENDTEFRVVQIASDKITETNKIIK
jgi:hypothetical protein